MDYSGRCTITATLRRFSSCDGEDSDACTEYNCYNDNFNKLFKAKFFPNGSCVENEGHVSIAFDADFDAFTNPLTFSCTASVIDASGNKRFSQSLALDLDYLHNEDELFGKKSFGFQKYLKRSTLFSDPSELLPDDCLTLSLEIDYEFFLNISFRSTSSGLHRENSGCYLRMDSVFGRELCEMSTVFRDMMECTRVESGPDRIPIPEEEYDSFQFIYELNFELKFDATLSRICQVYLLADKYDMQPIVQLCRRLLISVMRAMNTPKKMEYVDKDIHVISELAERFADDECLREIVAIYSDIKNELEGGNGELVASNARKMETEWNCKYRRGRDSFLSFLFSKNESELLEIGIYK